MSVKKTQSKPEIFSGFNDMHAFKASLPWQPYTQGGRNNAKIVEIYHDEKKGLKAAFVLFEPGAKAKSHTHLGYENIWLLEGCFKDELGEYEAGSLVVYEPGSRHQWSSEEGAFMYVTWTGPTEINS